MRYTEPIVLYLTKHLELVSIFNEIMQLQIENQ